MPSSSAAAIGKILNVEPGSKISVIARFLHWWGEKSQKLLGLKTGRTARAKISPVRGTIAMAMPVFALCLLMPFSSAFSTKY